MALPPHAQPASVAEAAVSWLPDPRRLAPADWQWRHRLICVLVALHLPFLAVLAVASGRAAEILHLVLPVGVLLAAACSGLPRQLRALAASLALLTETAFLVHLTPAMSEAHFHYFVVVALIALYQDWKVYALAIGFVLLQHGVMAVVPGDALFGHWGFAAVHAAFILGESAVLVLFWRVNELSQAQQQKLQAELSAGRSTVEARLAETERMRADLIGTVSHEFRTPLTGIRGAALTLLKRGERLDPASRTALLHAVLDQQERLSRLLENMLIAARATAVDPNASTDVDAVAAEVAMLASAGRPGSGPVSVVVEPGTSARIDRQALHQVLANLVDNALQHGAAGALPLVAGGRDERGVWVTVSNEGRVLDLSAAERLFEPFTQLDGGATRDREGIGVGLYVVRRLVEVYGGSVDVRSDSGWVTVEVRLEPAESAAHRAPLAGSPV
jgi:signal transduction histidine kinase